MTGDFNQARARLAKLLGREIPSSPDEARLADAAALNDGVLTEFELINHYNSAYGTQPVDEEEFELPDLPADSPWDFYNANTCLPLEHEGETLTFLLADPYSLEQLSYLVKKTWKKQLQ